MQQKSDFRKAHGGTGHNEVKRFITISFLTNFASSVPLLRNISTSQQTYFVSSFYFSCFRFSKGGREFLFVPGFWILPFARCTWCIITWVVWLGLHLLSFFMIPEQVISFFLFNCPIGGWSRCMGWGSDLCFVSYTGPLLCSALALLHHTYYIPICI